MKTVLFAWELGAGAGHLVNIRRLAQRLQREDIRLVAAVKDLESVALLDNINEIYRMPNWPVAAIDPETGRAASSATMNDVLVATGLANTAVVREMVAAWEGLFRAVQPDLVIADYAPGAALAARGRIALMPIGSGYTLPPHDMDAFPPLHGFSPPVHREEETLTAVNGALRELGLRPLQRLPQVFEGDARLVYVLPLIDPYAAQRTPPADGPLIDYRPCERDADAQQVFVYISGDTEVRGDVIAALRPVADRAWIYAPRLPQHAQHELAQAGARILHGYVPLAEALLRCRLVVHLGGSGFAMEAALAGVPQLTLVTHVERHLHGLALERAGIGRVFLAYDHARQLAENAIIEMVQSEELAQTALRTAAGLRAGLPDVSAGERFDAECRRLLG